MKDTTGKVDEVSISDQLHYQHKKNEIHAKYVFILFFLCLLLTGSFFLFEFLTRKNLSEISVKASATNATLSIQPATITSNKESIVNVFATTTAPIGFARVDINFNPSLVKLSQDPVFNSAALSKIVKTNTIAEANTTGQLSFSLGANPTNKTQTANGTFQIATLYFTPLVTGQTASISFASTSQIVDLSAIKSTLSLSNGTFVIPSTTPVTTTTPTTTPTTASTPTTTPTPTTTSNTTDKTPPTIKVSSPTNGKTITSSVWIGATGSDTSGIYSIEFYFDGTKVATCTKQSTCNTTYNTSSVTAGTHQISIKVTDNSANKNSTTTSVSVTKSGTSTTTTSQTTTSTPTATPTTTAQKTVTTPTATTTPAATQTPKLVFQYPYDSKIVAAGSNVNALVVPQNATISKVDYYVNGVLKKSDTTSPYTVSFDVCTSCSSTPYRIEAKATDTISGKSISSSVTVYTK